MSDHCAVWFTNAAIKEMRQVAKKDSMRAAIIRKLLSQIEENGWKLSVTSEVIKVLRHQTCIAEVRDVGSGGYRLFFFWHDTAAVRELWICRVIPKRDVAGKRRLNDICDAAEALRRRFLEEND
jgi:hypothetical protein